MRKQIMVTRFARPLPGRWIVLSGLAVAALIAGCSSPGPAAPEPRDEGLLSRTKARERIAAFEADPTRAGAQGILKIDYQGNPAYLFIAPCCDMFNELYDSHGVKLCAPSGGFAGFGDGRCPDALQASAVIAVPERRKATTHD
jgi:hypothetical protein